MLRNTKINNYHIVLENTHPRSVSSKTIYIVREVKRTQYHVTMVYGEEYSETTKSPITSFNIVEDIKQWHKEMNERGL